MSMAFARNVIVGALVAATLTAAPAAAQTDPESGPATFIIFVRGQQVGQERVTVTRTPTGWTIQGTGRIAAPFDLTTEEFSMRYAADWQPVELNIRATVRGEPVRIETSFGMTTAINEIRQGGQVSAKTDEMPARSVVLPTNFFGAYEALAARLPALADGQQLVAYVAPQGTAPITVRSVSQQRLQRPEGAMSLTKYEVTVNNGRAPTELEVWVDPRGRLARLEVPAAAIVVARQDVASVMTRVEVVRNPNEQDVMVQANGFSLAATVTRPAGDAARPPAVVLVGGATSLTRDEIVDGVPVLGQLAGDLAAAGFVVVRYDNRGTGQSGGRGDSASLADFADDARAVVRYLRDRKDVDRDRVALVGYGSEGSAIALETAAREKRVAAMALLGAAGATGADVVLDEQRRALDGLTLDEGERAERVDLQKRILAAVTSGKGWDQLPAGVRAQADTPWFRSYLAFDPARALGKARQPVLVVRLEDDGRVGPDQAERLVALANARKKGEGAVLLAIPGVDHTLAPPAATAGAPRRVSPAVGKAIADWLADALADR